MDLNASLMPPYQASLHLERLDLHGLYGFIQELLLLVLRRLLCCRLENKDTSTGVAGARSSSSSEPSTGSAPSFPMARPVLLHTPIYQFLTTAGQAVTPATDAGLRALTAGAGEHRASTLRS